MSERGQEPAKTDLRIKMKQLRGTISDTDHRSWSASVCRHASALIEKLAGARSAFTAAVFVPFRGEVDLWPFIEHLIDADYRVAVPRVNRQQQRMEMFAIGGKADLAPGSWGILEPKADGLERVACKEIDAILVPGLAFDRHGGRLGYGAGYYDRYFRQCESQGCALPTRVGAAFAVQLAEQVPMEAHDYAMDWIVTNDGYFRADKMS